MALRRDDFRVQLLETFRGEADDHLREINATLAALEDDPTGARSSELAEATFRELHTLKGASRSVGLSGVEAVCQACEAVLSEATREGLTLDRPILSALQAAVDRVPGFIAGDGAAGDDEIADVVARVEQAAAGLPADSGVPPAAPVAEAEPDPGEDPGPDAGAVSMEEDVPDGAVTDSPAVDPTVGSAPLTAVDTIRLSVSRVDALANEAEDLLLIKLAAGERTREARALTTAINECRELVAHGNGSGAGAPDLADALSTLEHEAAQVENRLARDQRSTAVRIDGLHDQTRRLRMTPASSVLDRFPAMVRDLAAQEGKDARLTVEGADLEIDRKVLEAVTDPLLHIVRNAIAHGIESPTAREAEGKPERGEISVSVSLMEDGRVSIAVADDGRGIDPEEVRGAAVRSRLLTEAEAEVLTDVELVNLVYRSGLSTSAVVTEIAGRGLGLAVVRTDLERLGGSIELESRVGEGTIARVMVPVAVATFRGLLVRAGGQPFLVGLDSVDRVLRVPVSEIKTIEGRTAIRHDDAPLAVAELAPVLGLEAESHDGDDERIQPCAVIEVGSQRAGFLVDEVLGEREALVKDLGPPLVRVSHLAGAAVLGDGQVVLTLRSSDLLDAVQQGARARAAATVGPAPVAAGLRILVVDDSVTTRTMEKNLLAAEGHDVFVAVDGVDAWTQLGSEPCDLVVSDVDMPRMNGFDLTAKIRADERLAELPVILVTALDSREDHERGIRVGANAYVIKSGFDQSGLLQLIDRWR